jgi:hypothetical protein
VGVNWAGTCGEARKTAELGERLRAVFDAGPEPLRYEAAVKLVNHHRDPDALVFLLGQVVGPDPKRARDVAYRVGTGVNGGRPGDLEVLSGLVPHMASEDPEVRRAAYFALGVFRGGAVQAAVRKVGDRVPAVPKELAAKAGTAVLRGVLADAAARHGDPAVEREAKAHLDRLGGR